MKDPELVMDSGSGAGTPVARPNSAPLGTNAQSEKASPGAKTMPDGEKQSHPELEADAKPGHPIADPQNLAKDAQAVGGAVGTQPNALGASSLGQQVGTAVAPGDQAAIARVVDQAPEPQGEIRRSHAESGDYSK